MSGGGIIRNMMEGDRTRRQKERSRLQQREPVEVRDAHGGLGRLFVLRLLLDVRRGPAAASSCPSRINPSRFRAQQSEASALRARAVVVRSSSSSSSSRASPLPQNRTVARLVELLKHALRLRQGEHADRCSGDGASAAHHTAVRASARLSYVVLSCLRDIMR